MITVIHSLYNVSYSLIYWSIHLFNLFHLKEHIGFVCVSKKRIHVKRLKAIAAVNYFVYAVKLNVICELK